jgi:hypothetical protein
MTKKPALPALVLVLALLLSACGAREGITKIAVYRVIAPYYRTSGALVAAEEAPFSPGIGIINTTISAFNAAPDDPKLQNPMPDGGRIVSYQLHGGALRLNTEGCGSLSGEELTLLCSCAALTFCAIDGINTVSVYSGEEALCAPLSIDDIILADTTA